LKVILFGATGMVGQSVLGECLRNPAVESVLSIGRSPSGRTDPKLRELVRKDLFVVDVPDTELQGYDACFFCLGVSSVGMGEADYTKLTYDLTLAWARVLARVSPELAFFYVSGAGTGGKAMWAQVKGRTEAALLGMFRNAYMVRLGMLRPVHGETPRMPGARFLYAVFGPLAPLIQAVAPGLVIRSDELGKGMIRAARERPPTHVLEMRDLQALGRS
jgi:uncharacterized protein YbjT (DUF2867 family)